MQTLYRKTLLPAAHAYDGETPITLVLEQYDGRHAPICLIYTSSEQKRIVEAHHAQARDQAIENAVRIAAEWFYNGVNTSQQDLDRLASITGLELK